MQSAHIRTPLSVIINEFISRVWQSYFLNAYANPVKNEENLPNSCAGIPAFTLEGRRFKAQRHIYGRVKVDISVLYVERKIYYHYARFSLPRNAESLGEYFRHLFRLRDLICLFCNRFADFSYIHALERVLVKLRCHGLPGDGDDRDTVDIAGINTCNKISGSGARGTGRYRHLAACTIMPACSVDTGFLMAVAKSFDLFGFAKILIQAVNPRSRDTIPDTLNGIAFQNQEVVYSILFKSVSETLSELAADKKYLGAKLGVTSILHTWGANLALHPHAHCIVPGGGLNSINQWVNSKKKFFIPVKVMSRKFRGKFLYYLKQAYAENKLNFYGKQKYLSDDPVFQDFLSPLYQNDWVVYCKPPFKNAGCVVEYLGRYTHRVAISNNRILKLEDGNVTFKFPAVA